MISVLLVLLAAPPVVPAEAVGPLRAAWPKYDATSGKLDARSVLTSVEVVPQSGYQVVVVGVQPDGEAAHAVVLTVDAKGALVHQLRLDFGDGPVEVLARDVQLAEGVGGVAVRVGNSQGRSALQVIACRPEGASVVFSRIAQTRCEQAMVCEQVSADVELGKRRANGWAELKVTTAREWTSSKRRPQKDVELLRWNGQEYVDAAKLKDPLVASASATSVLVEKGVPRDFYAADRAVDGVRETAWVEGVKGPGLGEALTLTLASPRALSALTVLGGCGASSAQWKKNHRVKALKVSVNGGEATRVELLDVETAQRVPLMGASAVTSVRLELAEVYPGSAYDDACLAEVTLVP